MLDRATSNRHPVQKILLKCCRKTMRLQKTIQGIPRSVWLGRLEKGSFVKSKEYGKPDIP